MSDRDNAGKSTIGIYRGAKFYLCKSNTNGYVDITLDLGTPGDMHIAR